MGLKQIAAGSVLLTGLGFASLATAGSASACAWKPNDCGCQPSKTVVTVNLHINESFNSYKTITVKNSFNGYPPDTDQGGTEGAPPAASVAKATSVKKPVRAVRAARSGR